MLSVSLLNPRCVDGGFLRKYWVLVRAEWFGRAASSGVLGILSSTIRSRPTCRHSDTSCADAAHDHQFATAGIGPCQLVLRLNSTCRTFHHVDCSDTMRLAACFPRSVVCLVSSTPSSTCPSTSRPPLAPDMPLRGPRKSHKKRSSLMRLSGGHFGCRATGGFLGVLLVG